MSVDAEVECDLLLAMNSLQGGLNNFCLAHIQRYRDTCGSSGHRCMHLFITATLQHIIKRPLKVKPSHCSLIAVEVSLCEELIALLVDELLFIERRRTVGVTGTSVAPAFDKSASGVRGSSDILSG